MAATAVLADGQRPPGGRVLTLAVRQDLWRRRMFELNGHTSINVLHIPIH